MKRVILLLLCSLLAACSLETPVAGPAHSAIGHQDASPRDPLEGSLKQAAERLLRTLQNGDPGKFLSLVSRRGLAVDIDGWIGFDALRKDFRVRKGWYCHYFDTPCLQEELKQVARNHDERGGPTQSLRVSYRDALNMSSGIEIRKVEVHRLKDGISGLVRVTWSHPPPKQFGLPGFLEFDFVFENDEWKLFGDQFPDLAP